MNRANKCFGIVALSLFGLLSVHNASGGFLDDLLKSPGQGQQDKATPQEEGDGKPKGLLDGLLDIVPGKKKSKDLIKKGLGVVQALQPIGEEEEVTIGQAVAVEAFSRFGGEYDDASLTRYVTLIGQTIAETSDRPNLQYHFAILNSQEQNAFATPGGYIFITIGFLKALKNEAELAGVLAHEIAHVTQKHMLETIRRGALLSNVSELTLSALKKDPQLFSNVIDEITDKLFTKGMDKDKEYEADAFGIDFAYRAGYHPDGLQNYLKTLQSQEGQAQSRFFTTHPSTETRISKLKMLREDFADGYSFPLLTKRFRQMMKMG